MMRLGLGSYTYVWATGVPGYPPPPEPLTPAGLLQRAAELGVHLVQFADHMPMHALSETSQIQLREEAARLNVAIELGTSGIDPDHLENYRLIALRLGAKLIRTVTDTPNQHPTPEDTVDLLEHSAPQFERSGVTLALENHDRFKASVLRHIIDEVASPAIGICLDTANSLGCSEGTETVLETLGPCTSCLHIKDYTARRLSHRFGFLIEGAPAGAGDLDIPHWLKRLREMGRTPNVILELWPSPEAAISATVAKEKQWAEQSVRYLRTLLPD